MARQNFPECQHLLVFCPVTICILHRDTYNRTCYILTLKNFQPPLVTFVTSVGWRASIQRIRASLPTSPAPSALSADRSHHVISTFHAISMRPNTISRKFPRHRFLLFLLLLFPFLSLLPSVSPIVASKAHRRYAFRFRLGSSRVVRGNRKSFTGHDELFLSRRRKIAGNFPATR